MVIDAARNEVKVGHIVFGRDGFCVVTKVTAKQFTAINASPVWSEDATGVIGYTVGEHKTRIYPNCYLIIKKELAPKDALEVLSSEFEGVLL